MCEKCKPGEICIDGLLDGEVKLVPAWDAHIEPPDSCNEATRKFIELAGVPGWAESGVDVFTALRDVWMRHVNDGYYDCVIADGLNVTDKVSVECAKCGYGLFGGRVSTPNIVDASGDQLSDFENEAGFSIVPWLDMVMGKYGVDIGEGDDKAVSHDGREIYGLEAAARKFLDLAGYDSQRERGGRFYLGAAMKRLSECMIKHIRMSVCIGGFYFVRLDEIAEIIDIECSACGASLRTVNIG